MIQVSLKMAAPRVLHAKWQQIWAGVTIKQMQVMGAHADATVVMLKPSIMMMTIRLTPLAAMHTLRATMLTQMLAMQVNGSVLTLVAIKVMSALGTTLLGIATSLAEMMVTTLPVSVAVK